MTFWEFIFRTLRGFGVFVLVIVAATAMAIWLKDTELVTLLQRKFDLLVQLAPLFFLGLHWPGLRSGPAMSGMLIGSCVAIVIILTGQHKGTIGGIHAGLYGLSVNLMVSVGGSLLLSGDKR